MTQSFPPIFPGHSPHALKTRRKSYRGAVGWILFVAVIIMVIIAFLGDMKNYSSISLTEFRTQLYAHNINSLTVDGDGITGYFHSPIFSASENKSVLKFSTELPAGTSANWSFTQWLLENAGDTEVRVDNSSGPLVNILLPFVPWALLFGFIYFVVYRQLRKQSAPSASLTPIPPQDPYQTIPQAPC